MVKYIESATSGDTAAEIKDLILRKLTKIVKGMGEEPTITATIATFLKYKLKNDATE